MPSISLGFPEIGVLQSQQAGLTCERTVLSELRGSFHTFKVRTEFFHVCICLSARLTLELPSFFDNTSPSSEDFPSFVSLADEPSPRPSGLWGNLKQYVELGTSDDRLQRTHESEEAPEEPKSAGETAERPERRPVPEKKEEEEPAAATEVTPDVTSGEKKSGEEVAEKKVTKEPKKESSETYHLLAQAKLRETREDLAKKTAGTPEEYDETGDYPSLCGSWQVRLSTRFSCVSW